MKGSGGSNQKATIAALIHCKIRMVKCSSVRVFLIYGFALRYCKKSLVLTLLPPQSSQIKEEAGPTGHVAAIGYNECQLVFRKRNSHFGNQKSA